jgi:hypothetical protein
MGVIGCVDFIGSIVLVVDGMDLIDFGRLELNIRVWICD